MSAGREALLSARTALLVLSLLGLPLALLHLGLGLSLTQPTGLWLWLLALPLILLHMLKPKRTERPVSSLLFWAEVARQLEASTPLQRLRRRLLLILQLSLVLLLGYALARPQRAATSKARSVVIIIDRSASMGAVEEDGTTRIEEARRQALELIDGLAGADEAMLIGADTTAATLQSWTDDKSALRRAIKRLDSAETRTQFDEALRLAAGALKGRPQGELAILSDGRLPSPGPGLELPDRIDYRRIGESGENVGLSRVDLLPSEAEKSALRLFVVLRNFGQQDRRLRVVAQRGQRPLAARSLSLAGGERRSLVLRLPDLNEGPLELRLAGEKGPWKDLLAVDDRAFTVVRRLDRPRVRVLGPAPKRLLEALAADGRVSVEQATRPGLGGLTPQKPRALREPVLSIIAASDIAPPDGVCLLLRPALCPAELQRGSEKLSGLISGWQREHPLMRFVDPRDLAVKSATPLILGAKAQSLLEVDGQSVLAICERPGGAAVVLGFALTDSNWSLRLSYPIFLRNLVSLALRESAQRASFQLVPGVPRRLAVRRQGAVSLIDPAGERRSLVPRDGQVFVSAISKTGLYRLEQEGAEPRWLAANLLDEAESELAPRKRLDLGQRSTAAAEQGAAKRRLELGRAVLALILGLALIEYAAWRFRW